MEEYTKEYKSIKASVYGLSTILELETIINTFKNTELCHSEDNIQYGTR